jgi:hypothetical protein
MKISELTVKRLGEVSPGDKGAIAYLGAKRLPRLADPLH